jgi:lantibiotic modifying enzyme
LGYQGTLIPDPHHPAIAPAVTDDPLCVSGFPIEPRVTGALRELDLRIPAQQRACAGEPIDLAALVDALRERLRGMLTLALAACPDATEESLLRKFPALPALLKDAAAEWIDAVALFHERLHGDASRLAAWLGYPKLPGLVALTPASSDAHAGGHKVLRLLFRDGRCIYYKPRAVTGEWLWDRLVHAANAHSSLQLASAAVLAGANGRFGWVASLHPPADLLAWDKNSPLAREYWRAAGATLCLAEHVRMTDLHMANVMATSRGPAPFDAESLGTPRFASTSPARPGPATALATVIDDLRDTGLLPGHSSEGLPDTSGLFGQAASIPGILVPRWSPCSDHSLRLEMVPAALVDHGNAPPGATALEVLPLLSSGYREAATALMRCRGSLTSPRSAWRWTLERAHAPRIVLRDTLTYGILLSRSLEAEQLQSAQHRRIALRAALRCLSHRSLPEAVLRTELRSLLSLHVPRFTALPGSRTLAGNSGRALVPRFLACSPAEAVLRRIAELSPQRLTEIHVPGLLLAVLGPHR